MISFQFLERASSNGRKKWHRYIIYVFVVIDPVLVWHGNGHSLIKCILSCKRILFFCFDVSEWLFFFLVEPVQTWIFKIIRILIIHEHFCRVDFDKSVQRSIILLNRPFLSSFSCASSVKWKWEKFNISANLWNSFDFIECNENLFSATSIRCDQSSSSLRFANTIVMTKWEMFSFFQI